MLKDISAIKVCFFCFSGNKEEENVANMKRENKLYSYADQKAEIELKKV